MKLILLALVTAAVCVAPAVAAPARTSTVTVYGTVGPGYTITLKTSAGKLVKSLPAGLTIFKIRDRSLDHDFHLTGAGVDQSTQVNQVGSYTWRVKLQAGHTYTYKCDPHEIIMIGHFKVT